MKGLGVFCGTFNPIHWGHLLMAEMARDQAHLEKVLFITSPNPPHRNTDLLDAELRYELVKAACAGNENFEVSRLEMDRQGPSYTVDTLRELQEIYGPDATLHFIIGEDNLPFISQWHRADEIFRMCKLLVAPRIKQLIHEGAPCVEKDPPPHASITMLDIPYAPISSSAIRNRVRAGRSILYMVPDQVNEIISNKRLYL